MQALVINAVAPYAYLVSKKDSDVKFESVKIYPGTISTHVYMFCSPRRHEQTTFWLLCWDAPKHTYICILPKPCLFGRDTMEETKRILDFDEEKNCKKEKESGKPMGFVWDFVCIKVVVTGRIKHWKCHEISYNTLTHWGRDKWTPFRRRHFQMHFLEWKFLNSD